MWSAGPRRIPTTNTPGFATSPRACPIGLEEALNALEGNASEFYSGHMREEFGRNKIRATDVSSGHDIGTEKSTCCSQTLDREALFLLFSVCVGR
jgi:hypothetical protein